MKKFCDKMELFINKHYDLNKNSGMLRVTVKDEIIFKKNIGFSDLENNTPFGENSKFSFYSLSKPFSAIGLLKLMEKGLVDIDHHPGKYVREANLFSKLVTIRQMLNHTSGLPDFEQNTDFEKSGKTGYSWQMREQLKELLKYPMNFEPGSEGMYANINYILCALIIENVSGVGYDEYMKKEVFIPLGMEGAMIDNEKLIINDRVKGYKISDGKIKCVDRALGWMHGAGDIVGTVNDVYCLNKAIKNKLLLKEETWKEILTPSPINSMGFGCTISSWHGKKRITHNGGHTGFRTLHIQVPQDDFDIIYLSNSGWGDARGDYAEAIYNAYYGLDNIKSDDVKMDVGYI